VYIATCAESYCRKNDHCAFLMMGNDPLIRTWLFRAHVQLLVHLYRCWYVGFIPRPFPESGFVTCTCIVQPKMARAWESMSSAAYTVIS